MKSWKLTHMSILLCVILGFGCSTTDKQKSDVPTKPEPVGPPSPARDSIMRSSVSVASTHKVTAPAPSKVPGKWTVTDDKITWEPTALDPGFVQPLLSTDMQTWTPTNVIQSVKLEWDPHPDTNVFGFLVFYGLQSRTNNTNVYQHTFVTTPSRTNTMKSPYPKYVQVNGQTNTTVTVSNMPVNVPIFFSAAAVNCIGTTSELSNEVETFNKLRLEFSKNVRNQAVRITSITNTPSL